MIMKVWMMGVMITMIKYLKTMQVGSMDVEDFGVVINL